MPTIYSEPDSFEETEFIPLDWVWPGWLLASNVVILGGMGGRGKNKLFYDWAARVSTGRGFPGETDPYPASGVIIVSLEDDPHAVVRPALEAAGADLGMVWNCSRVDGQRFSMPRHLPYLRAQIMTRRARLVLLDPLISVSSVPITGSKVRGLLDELNALAEDTGACIVVNGHHTKKDELAGSAQISAAVRVVMSLTLDPEDESRRVLSVVKGNNNKDRQDVVFRLVDTPNGAPRVEYLAADEAAVNAKPPRLRVLEALTDEPQDLQAITDKSGVTYSNVRVLLLRLCEKGLAVNTSRGMYALPESVTSQVRRVTAA
jgi:hypothetical protein